MDRHSFSPTSGERAGKIVVRAATASGDCVRQRSRARRAVVFLATSAASASALHFRSRGHAEEERSGRNEGMLAAVQPRCCSRDLQLPPLPPLVASCPHHWLCNDEGRCNNFCCHLPVGAYACGSHGSHPGAGLPRPTTAKQPARVPWDAAPVATCRASGWGVCAPVTPPARKLPKGFLCAAC